MRLMGRWGRRLGPVVATAAILAIGGPAAAVEGVADRPPPDCAAMPVGAGGAGAWYRLDPILDDGALVAQRLTVGRADGAGWTVDLGAEAFAAAPHGGLLLVGSDDGRASRLAIIDAERGCRWAAGIGSDIVRRAILAPDGRSWYEHRLRRTDRADLGIWHRTPGDGTGRQVLPALPADGRFGITWSTRLAWDDAARTLIVATCGEVACRTRLLDPATGRVRIIADPELGPVVGASDDHLVVRGACPGLPCPIEVVDLRDGERRRLVVAAGLAVLVGSVDGRAAVVYESADRRPGLVAQDIASGRSRGLAAADVRGRRPVGPWSDAGAEVPRGAILLAPDARVPADGVPDDAVLRVDEVAIPAGREGTTP